MSFEITIFENTYNYIPWSRCQLKVGRETVTEATIAGVELDRNNSEFGQVHSVSGDLRLKTTNEPDGLVAIGQVVEVLQADHDEWQKAMVSGRFTQGGVTRLRLEAVYE